MRHPAIMVVDAVRVLRRIAAIPVDHVGPAAAAGQDALLEAETATLAQILSELEELTGQVRRREERHRLRRGAQGAGGGDGRSDAGRASGGDGHAAGML
jgi:hypothetical protein